MKLTLIFDPNKQAVKLDYDGTQLKTWDMILAILEIAKLTATTERGFAIQRSLAEAAMAQQVAEENAAKLGRLIHPG